MKKLFSLLAIAALAVPFAAAAEKPAFDKADNNGDGKISIEEAKKAGISEKAAKDADLDGDGKLTELDWEVVDTGNKSKGDKSSSDNGSSSDKDGGSDKGSSE